MPAPETAWQGGRIDRRAGGPELLFGQMYEDSAVELDAFEPGGRIFCIASAGCTSFDLAARGDEVTAVDVNPAQIAYVRRRLAGGTLERGRIDRRFDRMRQIAPALGWTRARLERFCGLDQTGEQLEFWRRRLDTRRLRLALTAAFSPRLLRRAYDLPFVDVLPARFDRILRRRLERGFGRHPNSWNPFASGLLLGRPRETTPAPLALETADAIDYLEACPAGSFDGITLSNILDGADRDYGARLYDAVRRAAAPGAVVILRSMREPTDEESAPPGGEGRPPRGGAGAGARRGPLPHLGQHPDRTRLMGYRLRRHPFAVSAHFRHSLVLAYALPASALEPLLPPTLEPDRHGDLGFAAAAFVQTERMRPSSFPGALGLDFFLGGFRIFVRVAGRPSLRGLYILRSDTDRRLLTFFGNLLTSYRYRTVDGGFRLDGELVHVEVRPGVSVTADLSRVPGPLPETSPFGSLEEARRFAGPLPYTFHHEQETGRLLSVRGTRSVWDPQPVAVEVRELDFFSPGQFGAEPTLANAFYVSGIDYRWERGRLLSS